MSITMPLYHTGKNGAASAFAREMPASGTVAAIRAEDGTYDYFIQMEQLEPILLIDSWKSQVALDFHHASPMMEKILELRQNYHLYVRYMCGQKDILQMKLASPRRITTIFKTTDRALQILSAVISPTFAKSR